DVRANRAPAGNTFDALWSDYKKAETKGDGEGAQKALSEIRNLRIERNIRSLESFALARVADGIGALRTGESGRAEAAFRDALALGLCAVILLLPAIVFQGWAWLPLWWLAMLFIYMSRTERVVSLALLVLCVASAPLVKTMEARLLAQQNPLFWASLGALEGG